LPSGAVFMVDDVLLNRAANLERSIARAVEESEAAGDRLATDYTRQDALILNLLRACETAIDMAMHVVRRDRLGLPQNSRDAFELLQAAGRIDPASAKAMKRMVGFRNVAVHNYRSLDIEIVKDIVRYRLDDFRAFVRALIQA